MTQQRTREQALLEISRLNALHGVSHYNVVVVPRARTKRAIATCNNGFRVFSYVEYYLLHMTDKDFKQVVLHEIAHALTPFHKHDNYFKATCRRIGGNPYATSDLSYLHESLPNHLKPKVNYTYVCPSCGKESYATRLWKRTKSCGKCCPVFNPAFILKLKEN